LFEASVTDIGMVLAVDVIASSATTLIARGLHALITVDPATGLRKPRWQEQIYL